MRRSRSRCDAAIFILLLSLAMAQATGADAGAPPAGEGGSTRSDADGDNDPVDDATDIEIGEFIAESEDELTGAALDADALEALLREAAAFRENPVEVNSATLALLLRVPGLDAAHAARIITDRVQHGPVRSLSALVDRGTLSDEELALVRPYLFVRSSSVEHGPLEIASISPAAPLDSSRQRDVVWSLRMRATTQQAWEESWGNRNTWRGSGTFARVRASYRDLLSASLALEKDVGERRLTDHILASMLWRSGATADDGSASMRVGVGDFTGSWGQGLLLRSGGFPSSVAYPRRTDRLTTYDGSNESSSRRGVFVVASRGAMTVAGLFARTRLDAATDETGLVSSVRSSGYHRTAGEREGAGVLTESLLGVRVTVEAGSWRLSGSSLRFAFDPGLAPGDPVRKRFAFSGDELTLGGFDVHFQSKGLKAGCELASARGGGGAAVGALVVAAGSWRMKCGTGILSRDYWSPLGGGAPGSSGGSNGASAWLRTEYHPAGASRTTWRGWLAARITGRPWRTYRYVLPDDSTSLAIGCRLRSRAGWSVEVETSAGSRERTDGDPPSTVASLVRRDRISLRLRHPSPSTFVVRRAASFVDDEEQGAVTAASLRMDGDAGDWCTYVIGVTCTAVRGAPPVLVHYEPRLPGEFGLRSLNADGARWYARVRLALPSGLGLTIRAAGGPVRGRADFGVGLDVGG